jgi:hypothetical protein
MEACVGELLITLDTELEHLLHREARRRRVKPEVYARVLLAESLRGRTGEAASAPFGDLPRRTPEELTALAREQGVKPVAGSAQLRGDFWPEDEDTDEFLAWLRESRRDPRGSE